MSAPPKAPPIDLWGMIFNATSEVIIIAILGIVLFIVWFMWTFIYPLDAKTLIKSKLGAGKRRALLLLIGDEGFSRLYLGEPMPQGVMNIGSKANPRYLLLPRPYIPEEIDEVPLEDEEHNPRPSDIVAKEQKEREIKVKLNDVAPIHEEFALKRVFWSGVNRPVYIAYSGKAVAVAPQVLAALGLMSEKTKPESTPKPTMVNSWIKFITRAKLSALETKKDVEILFGTLLDPRAIKTVIPNLYTDAQLRKIHTDAFTAGQESMRGGTRNFMPIILIIIILIIGIIALKVAGVF